MHAHPRLPLQAAIAGVQGLVARVAESIGPIHVSDAERGLMQTIWLLLTSIICVPLVCKLIPGGSPVLGYLVSGAWQEGGRDRRLGRAMLRRHVRTTGRQGCIGMALYRPSRLRATSHYSALSDAWLVRFDGHAVASWTWLGPERPPLMLRRFTDWRPPGRPLLPQHHQRCAQRAAPCRNGCRAAAV